MKRLAGSCSSLYPFFPGSETNPSFFFRHDPANRCILPFLVQNNLSFLKQRFKTELSNVSLHTNQMLSQYKPLSIPIGKGYDRALYWVCIGFERALGQASLKHEITVLK